MKHFEYASWLRELVEERRRRGAFHRVKGPLTLSLALAYSGCGGLLPDSPARPPTAECIELDHQFATRGVVAGTGRGVALALSAGSLAVHGDAQTAMRATGVGIGVFAAVFTVLQVRSARRYVTTCTENLGGAPSGGAEQTRRSL